MLKNIIKNIYQALPYKKYVFVFLKIIWCPPQSVYQHLHFKDIFQVKITDKAKFLIKHYGFEVENELFWKGLAGGWEKVSMELWISLCKDARCIVDIGANTGVYALSAQAVNPSAKVYAFEPVQRVYEKLKANVALNHFNIKCFSQAVSDYDGKAVIYDSPTEHIYSVTVNKNLNSYGQQTVITEIATIKLDSFIRQEKIDAIDLIKIDVETHEAEVLKGFEGYLDKMRPTLLIEILNDEVARNVEALLKDKNYLYFDIDEIGKPKLVNHLQKSSHYNYLICQEPVAIKLNLI